MKRIVLICTVLTIAMTSVCFADQITGVWESDSKGVIAPEADPEKIEATNEALNNMEKVPTFLTARSDGAMVKTYLFGNIVDARIGKWYRLTPDKYMFIQTYTTLSGE